MDQKNQSSKTKRKTVGKQGRALPAPGAASKSRGSVAASRKEKSASKKKAAVVDSNKVRKEKKAPKKKEEEETGRKKEKEEAERKKKEEEERLKKMVVRFDMMRTATDGEESAEEMFVASIVDVTPREKRSGRFLIEVEYENKKTAVFSNTRLNLGVEGEQDDPGMRELLVEFLKMGKPSCDRTREWYRSMGLFQEYLDGVKSRARKSTDKWAAVAELLEIDEEEKKEKEKKEKEKEKEEKEKEKERKEEVARLSARLTSKKQTAVNLSDFFKSRSTRAGSKSADNSMKKVSAAPVFNTAIPRSTSKKNAPAVKLSEKKKK